MGGGGAIAAQDGRHDIAVLAVGLGQPRRRFELHAPVRCEALARHHRQFLEIGIAGAAIDPRVKLDIRDAIGRDIAAAHAFRHRLVLRLERDPFGGSHRHGGAGGAERFQLRHHVEHILKPPRIHTDDQRRAVGAKLDQPARRHLPEGFAHRRPRRPELARQTRFIELRARIELSADNLLRQPVDDGLGQRAVLREGRPRHAASLMPVRCQPSWLSQQKQRQTPQALRSTQPPLRLLLAIASSVAAISWLAEA